VRRRLLARAACPALILLDLGLPVLDGRQFLAAYRRDSGPYAPVVLMTATPDAARCVAEVGAAGSVSKPFKLVLQAGPSSWSFKLVELLAAVERVAD